MISFYILTHRFKRSMLEITSDTSIDVLWKYLNPLQKNKLPDIVHFKVSAGKKAYDIIRLYESGEYFFSKKVIDVLSQFVDMSNKCYPVRIKDIKEEYYTIYNLQQYPFLNKDKLLGRDEPRFYGVEESSHKLYGIEGTSNIIVSDEIRLALLKNKITNIELIECFGCSRAEYKRIESSNFQPVVHMFRDK